MREYNPYISPIYSLLSWEPLATSESIKVRGNFVDTYRRLMVMMQARLVLWGFGISKMKGPCLVALYTMDFSILGSMLGPSLFVPVYETGLHEPETSQNAFLYMPRAR